MKKILKGESSNNGEGKRTSKNVADLSKAQQTLVEELDKITEKEDENNGSK